MAALSIQFSNALIDWLLRGQALGITGSTAEAGTGPATLYVGLTTTTSNASAFGTEPTGGSYARVAIASTTVNWSATQGTGSTEAPSTGSSETTSNNTVISFPAPTANWGMATGFVIYDAPTGGTPLIFGALANPKNINTGDAPPAFQAGSLALVWS